MPNIDFFDAFRYMLAVVVTVYATVVLIQSGVTWYKILSQEDRYTALIRRYLIVSGLRTKISRFAGDVTVIVLLCVVCLLLWEAHGIIGAIGATLNDVRGNTHTVASRI